jgi:hypothetical protein
MIENNIKRYLKSDEAKNLVFWIPRILKMEALSIPLLFRNKESQKPLLKVRTFVSKVGYEKLFLLKSNTVKKMKL